MDNFVVSARKYRPATFVTVVGQGHITSTLKNAISRNQLAHAYLFCGPRGVGKTTCARIFAKAINCTSPVGDEACGECESCRSFNEGRSFNIHELDAASNNSVDDIRSLTDQVRIPPQIGRYSVYIIDEVHMLSAAAFNAFLKTLEEPPAHAVFILATTEKHKIIPTILSRCQIYDFNRIRVEDGVEYLKYIAGQEGVAFDDESLHLIAQKADGGMRDALSMFDKAVSFCGRDLHFKEVAQTLNVLDYDTYFNVTSLILAGNYPDVLALFDDVLRKGFSGQTFIGGLNAHFRDILMCKNPQTIALLEVTGTLLERYKKQGIDCDTGFLFEAIALLTSLDGTLRTATNQRLNVELGLMKLCGLSQKKNKPVTDSPAGELAGSVATAGRAELPPLVRAGAQASAAAPQPQAAAAQPAAAQPVTTQPTPQPAATPQSASVAPQQPVATPPAQAPAPQPAHTEAPAGQTIPELMRQSQAGQPSAPAPQQTASSADIPATQPAPTPAPAQPSAPTQQPAAAAAPVSQAPAPAQQPAQPAATKPATRAELHAMPQTISGTSIASILSTPKSVYDAVDTDDAEDSGAAVNAAVDPESEQKITEHQERFIRNLNSERPRIAMAFHAMEVSGNKISLAVPTEALYEEIMRNRTEILTLLAELASVNGMIELDVVVKEDTTARRPIKVEDKLRYLTEQNPTLNLLRHQLDMDIE